MIMHAMLDGCSFGGGGNSFEGVSFSTGGRATGCARARGVMYDADYDDAAAAVAAAAPPSEAPLPYRVCLCSGEEEWSVISLSRVQDLPR